MPRQLTNNYGLPEAYVRAVRNEKYVSRGNISVTTLIDSPRVRLLKRVHTYKEDVADTVWAVFGTGVHTIIERGSEGHHDSICEIAMSMNVNGWEVTGTTDNYSISEKTLTDWKVTSVWKVLKGLSKDDSWVKQTNIYATMLQNPEATKIINGVETKDVFEVNYINIICILKDWKKREAMYNKDYPLTPVVKLTVPMYSHEGMMKYISDRVILHQEEEKKFFLNKSDGTYDEEALTLCTDSERWSVPPIWKMKTKEKKNSIKNFTIKSKTDEEEAISFHVANLKKYPDLKIEKNQGADMRCSEYCPVNNHCRYWNLVKHKYEQ